MARFFLLVFALARVMQLWVKFLFIIGLLFTMTVDRYDESVDYVFDVVAEVVDAGQVAWQILHVVVQEMLA